MFATKESSPLYCASRSALPAAPASQVLSAHTTLTLKDPRNTMCSTTAGVSAMKTGTELYMSLYERANPPTRPGISFL